MNHLIVKAKKIHPDAIIPDYAHPGDAGMDIYSVEDKVILPGQRVVCSTGIGLEFPEGYVALVWDKSGVAAKHGVTILAGVGDAGYRGEYKIVMFNSSDKTYEVKKGDKIAQILIQPVMSAQIIEADKFSETLRGEGGFGSTGLSKKDLG